MADATLVDLTLINTRQPYRASYYRRLLTMTVQILESPDELRPG